MRNPYPVQLTDEQTEALIRELSQIIQNDRYPLSPRIVALKEILGQLRPEPEREPLPLATELRSAEQGSIWPATIASAYGDALPSNPACLALLIR
jgi:hypothetical protein